MRWGALFGVLVMLGFAVPGATGSGTVAAARDGRWIATRLPGLCRGCGTQARALNQRGQIVGLSDLSVNTEPDYHAVLWERLHPRDLGTLGGSVSLATDINDAGQVVGWSYGLHELEHAFIWQDGHMRDLGTLPDGYRTGDQRESEAWAVNEAGQVVGEARTTRGQRSSQRAFLWENGRMIALPALPGATSSGATGINDHGQIVGWNAVGGGSHIGASLHAVIWENGGVRDLGVLTDYGGAKINDGGQIAVSSGYLIANGRTSTRCMLVRRHCSVDAINESGQIVGDVAADNGWGSIGVLWQGRHAYRFHTGTLFDINDHGQMVSTDNIGHGMPDDGFVWTRPSRP